jgi:malonate transporter and related proteins
LAGLLANALAPIFLGLIAGYLAGRRKIIAPANVGPLVTFTMSFALPCSLFMSIEHAPAGILPQLKWIALALAVTYILTYAVLYALSRRMLRSSASDGAVLALTIAFPNVAAFGLPLLSAIYGPSATDSAAIALAVGAVTISPATLVLLKMEHEHSDGRQDVKLTSVWWHACTKPVVWAPLLGLVALLLTWHLPFVLERTLDIFGAATGASALFLTGLVVSSQALRFDLGVFGAACIKNLLQPAMALGVALLFRLPTASVREVVLICALPCGFFGLIFGKGFSVTPEIASSSLVITYVSSVVTLAITILLLGKLV